ncbi:hypothetical protein [Endothiovibrio diazotrophicus]
MKNSIKMLAFASIAIATLSGCGTIDDRYYVQREWSKSLRELGIIPLFPPREDVFVGDVYAYGYDPASQEIEDIFLNPWDSLSEEQRVCRRIMGMSPRLARLGDDFSSKIDNEYSKTISAPKTPSSYDNIVGNPAWGAADQKVKSKQEALDKLMKTVSDANNNVERITAEKQQLTWQVEKASSEVTMAETALNTAKEALVDVSAEQAEVDRLDGEILSKTDAKKEATRAEEDIAEDAPDEQKSRAQRAVTQATRDLEDAMIAKERAQAALTKKQTAPRDVSAEQEALNAAKKTKADLDRALVQKTHELTLATAAATKLSTESPDKITAAKAAVESAKSVRDAIAKAGAGLLQPQPRDDKYSIFLNDIEVAALPSKPDDTFGSRNNRMRLVGFPEFATVSFSQGDLSALIPIEAMGLGINISRSSIDRVSVKVPAAESYSLSAATVMSTLFNSPVYSTNPQNTSPTWKSKPGSPLASHLPFVDAVANRGACTIAGKPEYVHLRIVTEVFYARALDIALFSSDSFGMRTQLASPTTLIGAQTTADESSNIPAMTPATLDMDHLDTAASAALLARLKSRIGTTQAVPGGSVQLVNYSDRSIGLRRVFDRPIAIGMRGISIEYNPATKEFGKAGLIVSPVPSYKPGF